VRDEAKECPTNPVDLYMDLLKKCLTASIYDESSWRVVQGTIRTCDGTIRRPIAFLWAHIRRIVVAILQKNGMVLVRYKPFDPVARHQGDDTPTLFGFTMVGDYRLNNMARFIEDVLERNVSGDFIETGVWRGGTTIFMRALLKLHGVTDRVVWVADSFEGFPKPTSGTDGWEFDVSRRPHRLARRSQR
jgi:hypothetical protein